MSLLYAVVLAAGATSVADAPAAVVTCAELLGPAPTVKRVPGPQYEAGGLHKFLLGGTNRRYWTTEIDVPVLDLRSFAGGLTVKERTGSKQTRGLKFVAPDGRTFRVRAIDKNSSVLPEGLQGTFVQGLFEDQLSAHHPAGGIVATPLAHAAGVASVARCAVVLPDDAALGEFRQQFAGMLGMIEEEPRAEPTLTPGLPDVTRVVDTEELIKLLDAGPAERLDSRAFLRARLFDIWLSDWDRHYEQWNWGRRRSDGRWQAIPKDRDRVFENHNGFLIGLARLGIPHLMDFTPDYRKSYSYISNSRDQDRRLLADLDLAAWSEVASALQASLTDEVIDAGVATMPAGFQAADAGRLARILKARRDGLPRLANDLYRLISDKVDIHATALHEVAEIERAADGQVEIRLATLEDREPYFRRRFVPEETGEIRLYLSDGNDSVRAVGAGSAGPTVRVIGGNGRDVLEGPVEGIRFYESDDDFDREQKLDENGNKPRDWGSSVSLFPMADVESDIGLILGAGVHLQKYGFRAQPFRARHTLTAETATRTGWRFGYQGEWHRTGSASHTLLTARYSEIESLRFYGFGNETRALAPTEFYRVDQKQYLLAPAYVIPRGAMTFSVGPVAKYSETNLALQRFIQTLQPYGSDEFGQLGAQTALDVDTREPRRAARKGVRLRVAGSVYPAVWSVRETFGEAHGDFALHVPVPIPLRPSLAFRVGAKKLWGLYPFHEAAYLGGTRTVRGISRNRFAGDAYAFGNSELRLRLFRHLGIFGLADAGRVYLAGEDSDHWHTAVGGGLWFAFSKDKHVLSVTTARSEGHTSFYVKSGLAF